MPLTVYRDSNESRVTCMKNNAWWLCHKYDVNYMIMQWQYDKSKVCHDNDERNGGKLHGNISRNGYGNAIIGRYGGCFEEGNGGCMVPAKVARHKRG